MNRHGELCELPAELKIEWRIEQCYPHMKFESHPFYFAGTSWKFRLNTDSVDKDDYHLCVDLLRLSSGSTSNLEVTVVRSVDGKKEQPKSGIYNYDDDAVGHLVAQWPGKQLYEKMPYPGSFPSVTLTFTLKNKETRNITNSLIERLSVLADNLKKLRETQKDADLSLNVKGCKFAVHRLILEARSAKFAEKLKEMKTDELNIDDTDPHLMEIILDFIYKGDTNLLTEFDVFPTYIIAEKYRLDGLKGICSEYIRKKLTVEWLFDVLKFADEQNAKEINDFAAEFFVANVAEITETHSWETFSRTYKDKSIELLTCSVKNRIT